MTRRQSRKMSRVSLNSRGQYENFLLLSKRVGTHHLQFILSTATTAQTASRGRQKRPREGITTKLFPLRTDRAAKEVIECWVSVVPTSPLSPGFIDDAFDAVWRPSLRPRNRQLVRFSWPTQLYYSLAFAKSWSRMLQNPTL